MFGDNKNCICKTEAENKYIKNEKKYYTIIVSSIL